ncbi:hypothetical protein F4782DRAFT_483307 [Xylaria castorea]|nr:hypothetical protein F4782DRAFT_483307 [Xylaria castorea]
MMPNFLRHQTYPYAASSTGPYRGLLVRKYPCWDAQGPARDIFTSDIAGRIKTFLEQCLLESNSFVGFSLFMVGKLPEKTKPTIMIVSDDKPRRKAAFQIVKSKNILTMYPGFELGHCSVAAEFEDLKQLGSDTALSTSGDSCEDVRYLDDEFEPGAEVRGLLSTEVCALEYPSWRKPTRLYFQTSPNSHSHNAATATCGGLLYIENELYALTMAHAIHPIRHAIMSPEPHDDSSSQSDDFEITGMDDWDEDEEEDTKTLTAITSPGSKTSSENSDSEESLLKPCDSHLSSETGIKSRVGTESSIVHEEDCIVENYEESEEEEEEDDDDDYIFDMCEPIGSVVSVDEALDIAVIKMRPNEPMTLSFFNPIDTRLLVDSDPTDTSIVIKTTHHPEIRGERSTMPFYTRLPGKSNFLELYSVQLSTPVRHGDSGSWAFDGKGKLVGFVIAGNPKTGLCLLLPSRTALLSVLSLLRSRASSAEIGSVNWAGSHLVSPLPSLPDKWESDYDGSRGIFQYKPTSPKYLHLQAGDEFLHFFDTLDEDTMTVGSSLPPPSLFSHRTDRGTTPSTMAYSTPSIGYGHLSGTSPVRESLFQGDAGLGSSFASKESFLEGQAARLRKELERAWEIIQEKDKRLQEFTTGERNRELGTSKEKPPPLASRRYPQFEFGRDLTPGLPPSSPSEKSHYRPFPTLTASREASPETPNLSIYEFQSPETETMMRTRWLTQVDANQGLRRENQELKRGIAQAIEAISEVHGDRKEADNEGLLKIASDLNHILRISADSKPISGQVKVKKESEYNETRLIDIPPFPGKPQESSDRYVSSPLPPLPPPRQSGQSRVRPKHSRVPKFQRSRLPGITLELNEEDEDDEMEDKAEM